MKEREREKKKKRLGDNSCVTGGKRVILLFFLKKRAMAKSSSFKKGKSALKPGAVIVIESINFALHSQFFPREYSDQFLIKNLVWRI